MPRTKKEVPLETVDFFRTDKTTGSKIPVRRDQRGILCVETCHSPLDALKSLASFNPRASLEELREHLRDQLAGLGLPSDRHPRWIKYRGADWQEQKCLPELDPENFPAWALWIARVKALTEPLSEGRRAAELLWHINQLLARNFSDNDLWLLCQLLESYFTYEAGGKINLLAMTGATIIEARKAGPVARQRRTAETHDVIRQEAEAFWSEHRLYRNQAGATASQIHAAVNEALQQRGLLPKSGRKLSAKTIADHVGAFCRGKKTATG